MRPVVSEPQGPLGTTTERDLARLYRLQVREQADFALFIISPEGRMATWNRGVENMFGYSEQEWLGQEAGVIFTEEDQENGVATREMEAARENGRSADIR